MAERKSDARRFLSAIGLLTLAVMYSPLGPPCTQKVVNSGLGQTVLRSLESAEGKASREMSDELHAGDYCSGVNLGKYMFVADENGDGVPDALLFRYGNTHPAVLYTPDWTGKRYSGAEGMNPHLLELGRVHLANPQDSDLEKYLATEPDDKEYLSLSELNARDSR